MTVIAFPEHESPGKKESHALWNRSLRGARPEITEGFSMPGFAGLYYMWPEEYALLSKYVDLAQGDYLEIGSMCGIIAASLAKKYPQRAFVCVDKFETGHGTIAGDKATFLRNMSEHHLTNVKLIEGDSKQVVPTLSQSFGLAFIDANHAYDYVLADALNCWTLVVPGGFLVFHDYECVEETTRALHDFVSQTNACIVEVASSVAVVCKPSAPVPKYISVDDEIIRSENSSLKEQISQLEAKLQAIEGSKGWRLLNRYRSLKKRILG
jgi:predicted O-methyltransferase YrrM